VCALHVSPDEARLVSPIQVIRKQPHTQKPITLELLLLLETCTGTCSRVLTHAHTQLTWSLHSCLRLLLGGLLLQLRGCRLAWLAQKVQSGGEGVMPCALQEGGDLGGV